MSAKAQFNGDSTIRDVTFAKLQGFVVRMGLVGIRSVSGFAHYDDFSFGAHDHFDGCPLGTSVVSPFPRLKGALNVYAGTFLNHSLDELLQSIVMYCDTKPIGPVDLLTSALAVSPTRNVS